MPALNIVNTDVTPSNDAYTDPGRQWRQCVVRSGITGWTHRIWSLNFLLKGLNKLCSDSNICVADKSNHNNNIGV